MTSKEYVIWLKGFVEACNEYAPTPKQWDAIKDKLAEVNDSVDIPISPEIKKPNITPILQKPLQYIDPFNPYKMITYENNTILTSISGSGTIVAKPGYGSIRYNPSTSTTYGYPSGSSWHYTNSTIDKKIEKEERVEEHHNED